MAKKKKKWIQKAIKHPGALTRSAKAKKMTIAEFCSQKNLSALNTYRCNLWKALRKMN